MIQAANEPLAGGRNVSFKDTITIEGADLSAATLRMQVRLYPDAAGAALVDLTETASPAQGLSVSVDVSGLLPVSTIEIRMDKATMQALPAAKKLGGDRELAYDLVVSGGGFDEAIWFEGSFTVEGSVTR